MSESPPDDRGDAAEPDEDEHEEAWAFGLDDVDEDGVVGDTIEPGEPSAESALFVVLGVAVALALLAATVL